MNDFVKVHVVCSKVVIYFQTRVLLPKPRKSDFKMKKMSCDTFTTPSPLSVTYYLNTNTLHVRLKMNVLILFNQNFIAL